MSKNIKIALNYGIGLSVSLLLLWLLWGQSHKLSSLSNIDWWRSDKRVYALAALLLLPVNVLLESRKWQLLVKSVAPLNSLQSLASVLTGIAFSLITPNRIGEYPGRMLALNKDFSARLLSVSVLGSCAQLMALMAGGALGGLFYCLREHMVYNWLIWIFNAMVLGILSAFYWGFTYWSPKLEGIRWFRRFRRYGSLLQTFTRRIQWLVLGISLLRFSVYTLQYYLALRWLGVDIPFSIGYPVCALFFWVMAIIPSVSLAEIGIRGTVSWVLFRSFGADESLVFAATIALWLVNLLVPAAIGALLMLRVRLLR